MLRNKLIKKKQLATSRVITKLRTNTIKEVKEGAIFASVAPCNWDLLKKWKCKACLKVPNNVFVDYFHSIPTEAFALLIKDEKEATFRLIFRGSTTLTNEIHNRITLQTPFSSSSWTVKVHTGFRLGMESISKAIISKLGDLYKQEQYKDYNLKVYGHSLGGALASLAILKIQGELELNEDKLYLFTYGQPRVGNYAFVRSFNDHKFHSSRVTNYYDEVVHFPSYIMEDYVHFNNEIFIDKDSSVIQCNSSYFEDPKCSQKVPITYLIRDSHADYFIDFAHKSTC
ncbi:alpha/beta-hydrolase [Neoconidiobolus thromboides FSU 785]|nr:alpha/beta-hydrolase [Neoconidiobolus thromboides FSU 785]